MAKIEVKEELVKFRELKSELILALEEGEKFEKGNNAAGTRFRKHLLNVSKLAKDARIEVSTAKNARKEAKEQA